MRIGSLFAGIGGLELGLEWAGVGHTVWQVERDKYCTQVLAKHWPDATRYDDVCTVGAHNLAPVDVICGGFPCQPFSHAGKRKGEKDERHLWPECVRLVRDLNPDCFIGENVPGLLSSGHISRRSHTCVCGWFGRWRRVDLDTERPDDASVPGAYYQAGLEGRGDAALAPAHIRWRIRQGESRAKSKALGSLLVDGAGAATALHCWSLWQTEPRESRFLTCLRLKELMGVLNRTGEKIALPVVGRWLLVPTVQHGATRSLVFLKTWPKSGVMSNGVCWQRPTWVPRTDASASSLWPTPLSQEAKHGAATDYELRHDHPANVSSLRVVVAKWATPTVDDANNVTLASGQMQSLARDTNLWATPRAEDGERGQGSKSDGLSEDVTAWATPTTRDYKDTGDLSGSAFRQDGTPRDDTAPSQAQAWAGPTPPPSEAPTAPTDSSQPKPRRRGLNPRFGLWLMGLPTDWLDLPSGPSLPANQVESQSSER